MEQGTFRVMKSGEWRDRMRATFTLRIFTADINNLAPFPVSDVKGGNVSGVSCNPLPPGAPMARQPHDNFDGIS